MKSVAIKSIRKISPDNTTRYDIQVNCTSNFFADGILVHNCRVLMAAQMTEFGPIVTSYSRNGKQFENFKHIEKQIGDNLTQLLHSTGLGDIWHLAGGIVFDGEVVGNSFQELMRQARRKTDVQNDDSVYHIFDVIPMDDFKRGHWNAQLSKRLVELRRMKAAFDMMPNVELLPHIEVDLDFQPGQDQFNLYCKDMVSQGFEGVMIKNLDAPYICKRSTDWMKYKPTITVDLEVVGVEEGTGRNKGRLGALVCHGVDHGKEISVNVGSGFSDHDRTDYWVNRNLIVGQTAEILCDVITQNRDGTYSLRFPRFVRFRDDKENQNDSI